MQYEVKPGKEEEFEQGFLRVLELLRTLPGHIESNLYEDVASVGSYVILSRWATKEDYAAFLRSEAFKSAVAWGKAEILRSRPKHRVYQDDQESGGAGGGGPGGAAGGHGPARPAHSS